MDLSKRGTFHSEELGLGVISCLLASGAECVELVLTSPLREWLDPGRWPHAPTVKAYGYDTPGEERFSPLNFTTNHFLLLVILPPSFLKEGLYLILNSSVYSSYFLLDFCSFLSSLFSRHSIPLIIFALGAFFFVH
jgi:hypothetical protein